jgi:hypothetical protein
MYLIGSPPKITQLNTPLPINQHIFRLNKQKSYFNIPMDNIISMKIVDCLQYLDEDFEGLGLAEMLALGLVVEEVTR